MGCIGPEPEGDPTEWELLEERIEIAAEGSLPTYEPDAAAADANFFTATGGEVARTSDSAQAILQAVRSDWNAPSLSSVADQTRGELLARDVADIALASEISKLGSFVAAMTVIHSLSELTHAQVEALGIQNFWMRLAETNTAGLAAQEEVERFLDECEGPGASFEAGVIAGKRMDASLFRGLVYTAGSLARDVGAAADGRAGERIVIRGWDYYQIFVDRVNDGPDFADADDLSIKLSEIMSRATGGGIANPASLVSADQVFDYQAHLVTVSSEAVSRAVNALRAFHQAAMNSIRNLKG